jgi:ribosomal protein S18 acetylase RimI-like enzyme
MTGAIEVRPLSAVDPGELATFLEPRPFHFRAGLPGVDRARFARAVADSLVAGSARLPDHAWVALQGGSRPRLRGALAISPDAFYSEYFGLPCAKGVHFHAGEGGRDLAPARALAARLREGAPAAYGHLAVRVLEEEHAASAALEEAGFARRDTLVDWWLDVGAGLQLAEKAAVPVREATPADAPRLARAMEGAFSGLEDRFVRDPGLPLDRARTCLENWFTSSLKGFADATLVAEIDGEIAGCCTVDLGARSAEALGERVGDFPIVAVNERARRRGVYLALLHEAVRRMREAGCRRATMTGFVHNHAAIGAWARAGFRPLACRHTLTRSRPGASPAGAPQTE